MRYYLQKFFALFLKTPLFKKFSTIGFSLVASEKYKLEQGINTRIIHPFYLKLVSIGDYSYVTKNSNITNCIIGKFCSIGPNFCCGLGIHPINGISTSPMFYSTAKQNGISLCKESKITESKQTIIGHDVFIGANVTVIDGVTIGTGAVIGAGAVVTKDIPPYAVALGVPAKIVKYRFDDITIEKLLKMEWWNWEASKLQRIEKDFFDSQKFIKNQ